VERVALVAVARRQLEQVVVHRQGEVAHLREVPLLLVVEEHLREVRQRGVHLLGEELLLEVVRPQVVHRQLVVHPQVVRRQQEVHH